MRIKDQNQLRELYGNPTGRAKDKVLSNLDSHAIHFISKSPFLILATHNMNNQMDASPRGGVVGFVQVTDDLKIVIPDAKGNKRLDSLINIVETGRVGILFLLPGIDETLRINGTAHIDTDPLLLNRFSNEKNLPKSCIVVKVEEMFLHCAKALMRSKLWSQDIQIERSEFPTMGQMLKDQLGTDGAPESYQDMVKRYMPDL